MSQRRRHRVATVAVTVEPLQPVVIEGVGGVDDEEAAGDITTAISQRLLAAHSIYRCLPSSSSSSSLTTAWPEMSLTEEEEHTSLQHDGHHHHSTRLSRPLGCAVCGVTIALSGVLRHIQSAAHVTALEASHGWLQDGVPVVINGHRYVLDSSVLFPAAMFGQGRMLYDDSIRVLLPADDFGAVVVVPDHEYTVVEWPVLATSVVLGGNNEDDSTAKATATGSTKTTRGRPTKEEITSSTASKVKLMRIKRKIAQKDHHVERSLARRMLYFRKRLRLMRGRAAVREAAIDHVALHGSCTQGRLANHIGNVEKRRRDQRVMKVVVPD